MASWLDSMGSSASGCVEGSESSCDEEVSMMEAEAHERRQLGEGGRVHARALGEEDSLWADLEGRGNVYLS